MIDKSLYVAMSGSKATFDRMAQSSNNLANANTNGFKSELIATRALYANGETDNTRAYAVQISPGSNLQSGAVQQTGSPLDVAINGDGWIVVKAPDGSEMLSRNGSLRVNSTGKLENSSGNEIVGKSGPINISGFSEIDIAKDGTVSGKSAAGDRQTIGALKLSSQNGVIRNDNGMFSPSSGPIVQSENISLVSGALEMSNVNVVEEMTRMIELSRQFDLNIKVMQAAEANSKQASEISRL